VNGHTQVGPPTLRETTLAVRPGGAEVVSSRRSLKGESVMGGTVIWRVIADAALALLYLVVALGVSYGVAKPRALVERLSHLSPWWVRWFCAMLAIAALWMAIANGADAGLRLMVDRLHELMGS